MNTIITRGVSIPRLGFGTFRMSGCGCQPVVESALALGYRHLDTAAMYENEDAVGAAIAASNVARGKLFVTTKVWHDQLGTKDSIRRAFDTSIGKLKLDYVDLYMIHWPSKDMDMAVVMETLTTLRDEGHARAIGVCNLCCGWRLMRYARRSPPCRSNTIRSTTSPQCSPTCASAKSL